jgi:hypothetical protein
VNSVLTYGQVDYRPGAVVEVSDEEGRAYVEAERVEEVKEDKRKAQK